MKFLWAVVYTVLFVAAFIGGTIVVQASGLGVMITESTITSSTTYARALATLRQVNTFLSISFAILVVVAVWSIRHPGGLRATFNGMLRHARNTSGRELMVYWIVAVFTIIGYALAIYATWHYAKRRLAQSAPAASAHKTCPECAETVLAAARLCRFCRHEFTNPSDESGLTAVGATPWRAAGEDREDLVPAAPACRYSGEWQVLAGAPDLDLLVGEHVEVSIEGDTMFIDELEGESSREPVELDLTTLTVEGKSHEVVLTLKDERELRLEWWDGDDGRRLVAASRPSRPVTYGPVVFGPT